MNFNIIRKKNRNCVQLIWSELMFDSMNLSDLELELIISTIVDFQSKHTIKDIVIAHYVDSPIYVTIERKNIYKLIHWLIKKFSEKEKYEICHQLKSLQYDNN